MKMCDEVPTTEGTKGGNAKKLPENCSKLGEILENQGKILGFWILNCAFDGMVCTFFAFLNFLSPMTGFWQTFWAIRKKLQGKVVILGDFPLF